MSTSDEIVRLSALWYALVGSSHHKDRDCHWYIMADYSYGQHPTYVANHYGYIYRDWSGPARPTWAEAEADLLAEILAAINEIRSRAERWLADPDSWSHDEAGAILAVLDGHA